MAVMLYIVMLVYSKAIQYQSMILHLFFEFVLVKIIRFLFMNYF